MIKNKMKRRPKPIGIAFAIDSGTGYQRKWLMKMLVGLKMTLEEELPYFHKGTKVISHLVGFTEEEAFSGKKQFSVTKLKSTYNKKEKPNGHRNPSGVKGGRLGK